MKILITGYHNPHFITITEYIEKAVLEENHTLVTFDDWFFGIPTPRKVQRLLPFLEPIRLKLLNKDLVKLAKIEKPDLCIITGGHRITSQTVKDLKKQGIKTVLWTIDAPINFQPIIEAAPEYDHVFCGGSEAVEILKKHNIKQLHWLPFAAESTPPLELNNCNKKYDLVFIGSHYPNRVKLLEQLTDFDLNIWGPGWEKLDKNSPLRNKIKGGSLKPKEWAEIYNEAKIIIVIHYQMENILCYQASPKLYEALLCKGFVLCDEQKDAQSLFEDNKHLVYFKDSIDLKKLIDKYLIDNEKRNVISEEGRNEIIAKHTYRKRIKELLQIINC